MKRYVSPYSDLFNKNKNNQKSTRVRLEFIMDSITDSDIIEKLNSCANKAEYIRRLIRKDLKE